MGWSCAQSRWQGEVLGKGTALDSRRTDWWPFSVPQLSPPSAGDDTACHHCGQLKPPACLLPGAARGEETQAHVAECAPILGRGRSGRRTPWPWLTPPQAAINRRPGRGLQTVPSRGQGCCGNGEGWGGYKWNWGAPSIESPLGRASSWGRGPEPLSWNPSSGFLLEPLTSCRGRAAVVCVNVCLGYRDPCTSGGGGPAGCSAYGAGPEMLPPPKAGVGSGGVRVTSSQLRQPPWAGSWGCQGR